ncbi:MAG: sigma-54 dependent transcriptional regulator, partial [Pseudomonadota bacterium]
GKELVAKALHRYSTRREQPFVAVHCGAIPDTLLESSFFGHVKGAFTGADRDRTGFFVLADEGTLFLDEIDALSLEGQAKLTRVLQESKVRPVGAAGEVGVNVRVLSASNQTPEQLVTSGRLREDLFYRLHVIRIDSPPLRDRLEDIPLLVAHFLLQTSRELRIPEPLVGDDVLSALMRYAWPGNVRELRNEIERLVALSPRGSGRPHIAVSSLRPEILGKADSAKKSGGLSEVVDKAEREAILAVLNRHDWNKTYAAKELSLTRASLRNKMKRLKIPSVRPGDRRQFQPTV